MKKENGYRVMSPNGRLFAIIPYTFPDFSADHGPDRHYPEIVEYVGTGVRSWHAQKTGHNTEREAIHAGLDFILNEIGE